MAWRQDTHERPWTMHIGVHEQQYKPSGIRGGAGESSRRHHRTGSSSHHHHSHSHNHPDPIAKDFDLDEDAILAIALEESRLAAMEQTRKGSGSSNNTQRANDQPLSSSSSSKDKDKRTPFDSVPRNSAGLVEDHRVIPRGNNRLTLQNPKSRTPYELRRLPLRSPEYRTWLAAAHAKYPFAFTKFVEGAGPQTYKGPNGEYCPPADVVISKAIANKDMVFVSDGARGSIWMVDGKREDVVLAMVEGGWSGSWEILGVGEGGGAGKGKVFLVRRAVGYEKYLEEEARILREKAAASGG